MPLTGNVQVEQNGIVVSARAAGAANPVDVAVLDPAGNQLAGFDPSRPANASVVSVNVTTVAGGVVLKVANPARRQIIIYNASGANIFVAFAATASAAAYTVRIANNGSYETPKDSYTGVISAIAQSGSGPVLVTEITT